ncbi:MAG: hypothetical protein DHS20C11_16700 [Lysobacteraceae bacterium]|nr:MAG: hypothetical protein DHS20C11_16700 [Xanthomonadaceae bacterium]
MSISNTFGYISKHPWTKTARLSAFGRLFHWQLIRRFHTSGIIFDWIDGTRLIVLPGETGVTGNVYCGLHEFTHMAYVLQVCTSDDFFVDVGANVGSYTVLACGARQAKGLCFEPAPGTYQRLRANLGLNDLFATVTALQQGVGDANGTARFTTGLGSVNHIVGNSDQRTDTIDVPVTTLDHALRDEAPTIIKIDVEGYEEKVLASAAETLARPELHSIIAEINGSLRYGDNAEPVLEQLRLHGFEPCRYDPFTRRLTLLDSVDGESGNTLFIKNQDLVRRRLATAKPITWRGLSL